MRWKKYSVNNNKTPEHDQYAKKKIITENNISLSQYIGVYWTMWAIT